MCGIAFVINYDTKNTIDLDMVKSMFASMKRRGTEASGMYIERQVGSTTKRVLFKSPIESDKLWTITQVETNHPELQEIKLTGHERLIMLHTRTGTTGSERDNNNNMPIYSKNYVLIHNGVLYADRDEAYPYLGEVDSEAILAVTESTGLKKAITSIRGSMAIAIKKIGDPFLFIYRRSNPLYLLYFKDMNILFGCSCSDYVPHVFNATLRMGDVLFRSGCSILEVPEHELFKLSLARKSIEHEGHLELDDTAAKSYSYSRDIRADKIDKNLTLTEVRAINAEATRLLRAHHDARTD